MATATVSSEALNRTYRQRLDALQAYLAAQIAALYNLTGEDIDAEVDQLANLLAPLIIGAQSASITMAAAYLIASLRTQTGDLVPLGELPEGLVGFDSTGQPIRDSVAVVGPLVKERIGSGFPLSEALAFGLFTTKRLAAGEVVRTMDVTTEAMTRGLTAERAADPTKPRITGWRGVIGDSCGRCAAHNGGDHDLSTPIYRHPACNCVKQYIAVPR